MIAKLAAYLGVPLNVTVDPTGRTTIGFADPELRISSGDIRNGELFKPRCSVGKTVEEAYCEFVSYLYRSRITWPEQNLDEQHELVVAIPKELIPKGAIA